LSKVFEKKLSGNNISKYQKDFVQKIENHKSNDLVFLKVTNFTDKKN